MLLYIKVFFVFEKKNYLNYVSNVRNEFVICETQFDEFR